MLARTPGRRLTCALATTIAALALPAGALAATGGGGIGGGSGGSGGSSGSGGGTGSTGGSGSSGVSSGTDSRPVSTSGGGLTLRTTSTAMLRSGLTFAGTATGAAEGQTIQIERSGRQTGWRWEPTATATVGAGGHFTTTWSTDHIGRFAVRAVAAPSSAARGAIRRLAQRRSRRHAAATSSLTVTVYLPAKATLYGPGLWGRRTACGQTLTRDLIGVANKSLPCGTKVSLDYGGHTLVVPVVDHGPYANGASWDLTMATGQALGMTGTAQIGAVSLPTRP